MGAVMAWLGGNWRWLSVSLAVMLATGAVAYGVRSCRQRAAAEAAQRDAAERARLESERLLREAARHTGRADELAARAEDARVDATTALRLADEAAERAAALARRDGGVPSAPAASDDPVDDALKELFQ